MIAAALLVGTICAGTTGAGCFFAGYSLFFTITAYAIAGIVSTLLFIGYAASRQARFGPDAGRKIDRTPGGQVHAFD